MFPSLNPAILYGPGLNLSSALYTAHQYDTSASEHRGGSRVVWD